MPSRPMSAMCRIAGSCMAIPYGSTRPEADGRLPSSDDRFRLLSLLLLGATGKLRLGIGRATGRCEGAGAATKALFDHVDLTAWLGGL